MQETEVLAGAFVEELDDHGEEAEREHTGGKEVDSDVAVRGHGKL